MIVTTSYICSPCTPGVYPVVQRFRSDLGLYVPLHCLVTDGTPASAPTPERMTAVLAQVHKATASVAEDDELDLNPALATCVQLGLAGPHLAPPEPAARPPLTESAVGMQLFTPRPCASSSRLPGAAAPPKAVKDIASSTPSRNSLEISTTEAVTIQVHTQPASVDPWPR